MFATTAATTTIVKLRTLNRRSTTSSAKNVPAIGVLNVAEIPPAAAAATIRTSMSDGCFVTRPIVDASEAAIRTIGPSRPAAPPPPSVNPVATSLAGAMIGRTNPPARSTATMTYGTPAPCDSEATRETTNATGIAAIAGTSIRVQPPARSLSSDVSSSNTMVRPSTRALSATAANPAASPTATASSRGTRLRGTRTRPTNGRRQKRCADRVPNRLDGRLTRDIDYITRSAQPANTTRTMLGLRELPV